MSIAEAYKPEAKREALKTRPGDFENRLFFAARNLAIEALMLRIETGMLRKGFDVDVEWRESSYGGPTLAMKLKNPKLTPTSAWTYAEATVSISRDRINVLERHKLSDCFYSVTAVHPTEHWPFKVSKYVQGFRDLVKQLGDEGYFTAEVNKVNYPFEYNSSSSY